MSSDYLSDDDDTSDDHIALTPPSHSPDEDIYFENPWVDQHSGNQSSRYVLELLIIDITNSSPYNGRVDDGFGTGFADAEEDSADGDGSDWETVTDEEEAGKEEADEEEVGEDQERGEGVSDVNGSNGSRVHLEEPTTRTYHPTLTGEFFDTMFD